MLRTSEDRIVIVGASLTGVRAARALRAAGFTGSLTLIGDELCVPSSRSTSIERTLAGWGTAEHAPLPALGTLRARWRLGIHATRLDRADKQVHLSDGTCIGFDRLLIATGTRPMPWRNQKESTLNGVYLPGTQQAARQLSRQLVSTSSRVLVIGAGFVGLEIASACREHGAQVAVVEHRRAPLVDSLGNIGMAAADLHRAYGVDLRCGLTVTALDGNSRGRLRRAYLSDGTVLAIDVAVNAQRMRADTEWLQGSSLAVGPHGLICDTQCRVLDVNGIASDDISAAGAAAWYPHSLYEQRLVSVGGGRDADLQADTVAHSIMGIVEDRGVLQPVPAFTSRQFGVTISGVGVPAFADELIVAQGSIRQRRFIAAYGYRGRITAAVAFDQDEWLDHYQSLIQQAAPFPPSEDINDPTDATGPVPAGFPDLDLPSLGTVVAVSEHSPNTQNAALPSGRSRVCSITSVLSPSVRTVIGSEPARASVRPAALDAIVVPTARSCVYLDHAIELADAARCYLIVLCSGRASAHEAARRAGTVGVQATTLDIPPGYGHRLLSFATNTFPEALYSRRTNDLFVKRNIALVIARHAGWEKLFFLDDDVRRLSGELLRQAASSLSVNAVAGFLSTNFPDNSVVRHAQRLSGKEPGVSLSINALAVDLTKSVGFFPAIYNADWLYQYDSIRDGKIDVLDVVQQHPYNPFRNPLRAASEEFGDVLAEGVMNLLASGVGCAEADKSDWEAVFAQRRTLIGGIRERLSAIASTQARAALISLREAERRLNSINAQRCQTYISLWRDDLDLWHNRLDKMRTGSAPSETVKQLGLAPVSVLSG